jgi:hypothetical protein
MKSRMQIDREIARGRSQRSVILKEIIKEVHNEEIARPQVHYLSHAGIGRGFL